MAAASKDGSYPRRGLLYETAQKDVKLAIVFQGDAALRNTYAVLEPKSGAGNAAGARELAAYVLSPEGRAVIGAFGIEILGEPLFTPEGKRETLIRARART
jgi:ABC-type tungstate transport system permease subunit